MILTRQDKLYLNIDLNVRPLKINAVVSSEIRSDIFKEIYPKNTAVFESYFMEDIFFIIFGINYDCLFTIFVLYIFFKE